MHPRSLALAGLAGVLALGALQRLDNLHHWRAQAQAFFHDGRPVLMSVDGYHYLDVARDLREGAFAGIDRDRTVPEGQPRPWPPPLLPVLLAGLAAVSGASLDWLGALVPPLLALSLALPVYALGRRFGDRGAGVVAALFALASPFYLSRSVAGFLDTDCLNATLAVAIPYLWLRFAARADARRRAPLWGALGLSAALLWWWDYGRVPALAAVGLPLALAFAGSRRHWHRDRWIWIGLALLAALILLRHGGAILDTALQLARYTRETDAGPFPAPGADVLEQHGASAAELARRAVGGAFAAGLAAAGLGLLAWRRPRELAFLGFPLGVAALSPAALRYLLFAAPVAALGIGAACHGLWTLPRGRLVGRAAAGMALAAALWPLARGFRDDDALLPGRFAYQAAALSALATRTPEDAVVWADWGHGYPIQYFARRGTLADGAHHGGERLYLLSVPLALRDFRAAANWIRFFTAEGLPGLEVLHRKLGGGWSRTGETLKRLLAAGPEGARAELARLGIAEPELADRWLAWLFPAETRPAYVYLDFQKIGSSWFRYGSWDFARRDGTPFAHVPFHGVEIGAERIRAAEMVVDLATGVLVWQGRRFPLARIAPLAPESAGEAPWTRDYGRSGNALLVDVASRSALMLDDAVAGSVGHALYVNRGVDPRHFELVLSRYPLYQVWRVRPDPPAAPRGEAPPLTSRRGA